MKVEFTVPHNDDPDVVHRSVCDELERLGIESMLQLTETREGDKWRASIVEPRFASSQRRLDELPAICGVVELAAYLDVPVASVRKWRYIGTGPRSIKVGRHVRYRREDVLSWLDEQTR